jgi:adenylate cyclase
VSKVFALFNRGIVYWAPLTILCFAAALRLAIPDFIERLSLIAFDTYQKESPRPASDAPIRIVDIDDKSLKDIGQWPWPRSIVAELLDKLREAGAAVVVFDVLFSEPDRTSPKLLLPLLTSGGAAEEDAKRLLQAITDPDERLAAAIGQMPVVLGFALTASGGTAPPIPKAGFATSSAPNSDPLRFVLNFPEAIADLPALQKAAAGNGAVTPFLDWDGVLRREPLLFRLDGKPVPSLAAETLRVAVGARQYLARGAGASGEQSYGENTGLNSIKIGPLVIPTDSAGRVWLHYTPSDKGLYISAADIFSGKFDRSRIADNIVLVGASAKGLNDLHPTPLAPDTPGTEIHAQLIEQVLQGSFLTRPDWVIGVEVFFIAFVGLLLILLIPRVGAITSGGVGAVAMIVAVAASWFAFQKAQLLIDPVYPILVLAIVYVITTLLSHRETERRQKEIRQAFSRYMSPHMVAELAKHPEKLRLGGESKTVTIMFSDIRGFTSLSEGLTSAELGQLINEFLTPMTEIITEHKGTIDKFIGDCIMAFWNAPLDDPDHAKNAIAAAQAMRKRLIELNQEWAKKGRPELQIGIGINTGECSVGNFGSQQRFDYSLLGDPVNLASRLEGLTKQYGVDFIIGEETAHLAADPGLVELDLVAVKGKSKAVRIYTLPPHPIAAEQFFARHTALLDAYRQRDWEAALGMLDDKTLSEEAELAPVYDLFRQRIAQLQIDSPPGDWDGVFVAQDK